MQQSRVCGLSSGAISWPVGLVSPAGWGEVALSRDDQTASLGEATATLAMANMSAGNKSQAYKMLLSFDRQNVRW